MKKILSLFILLYSLSTTAQQADCNFTVEEAEGGGEIKTTTDYLMYEKVFGGTSEFIFFSLTNSVGTPVLNFQLLAKSKGFPQKHCIDENSKIYIQLTNNKIVTLISANKEQCASLVYDADNSNNLRILTGNFLFTKGSLEELKNSTISFIRVKYTTEIVDYPIKKELSSETTANKYYPDTYFINYIKCLE